MAHCKRHAPGSNRRSERSGRIKLLIDLYLTVALLMLISSCTSLPKIPSPPFRAAELDTAALRDKVIVIDPGHGGPYGGAVGRLGLKESEVNLGVALYLWGLLVNAGAQPVMTRTADTAVVRGTSKGLHDDLLARSRIGSNAAADLFISIHHNSNVHDPAKNDLAIFYKLSPPDPSRELAICVMERMKESFDAPHARVLPGNFSVLRETGSTAILGEASYLTHRENEKRLHLHDYLKMEAEAYFAGICDYCKRGIPSISGISPSGVVVEEARPEVVAGVADDKHGKGIDISSIKLYLDGKPVSHRYEAEAGLVRYVPEKPLAGGTHSIRLEARNLGGNSARPGRAEFTVSRPPARIEGGIFPDIIPPDGSSRCRVTARVVDDNRNPVADGTPVSFSVTAGRLVETVVPTREGVAVTHLEADVHPGSVLVTVACGTVSASYQGRFASPERGLVEIYIHDSPGSPVEHAQVAWGKERYCETDRLGYCLFQSDAAGIPFTVQRDGYRPVMGVLKQRAGLVQKEEVALRPVDGGLLRGKVIMLDPRGENEGPGTGGSRDRQRFANNLQLALHIGELLRFAGAGVVLTRMDDTSPGAAEKVLQSEEVSADLVITLDHAKRSGIVYYYNSSKGKLLAGLLRKEIADGFSCRRVALGESTDFLIVHTGMPAVAVNFGDRGCKNVPGDGEVTAWKKARAVYQAVRSYFAELSKGDGEKQ
jgi:N-acetylmuramoyl-L-alanine amidase